MHVAYVQQPYQEDRITVRLQSFGEQERAATYTFTPGGEIDLNGAYATGGPTVYDSSNPAQCWDGELSTELVNNFDFYRPLLEEARVTAVVELNQLPQPPSQ